MGSNVARIWVCVAVLAVAGCSTSPFRKGMPDTVERPEATPAPTAPGSGPVVTSPEDIPVPAPGSEPVIDVPPPIPLPKERPRVAAATLSPASKALVGQAQAQRKRGDFPGATVSLERAIRIEPSNGLLWIEMGWLRMDQGNFPQAESMGRKALSMSVADDRTQSQAWALIAESLKARGRNPQAQEALERSRTLAER
jgi:Tfp pilus assembly protein PilF